MDISEILGVGRSWIIIQFTIQNFKVTITYFWHCVTDTVCFTFKTTKKCKTFCIHGKFSRSHLRAQWEACVSLEYCMTPYHFALLCPGGHICFLSVIMQTSHEKCQCRINNSTATFSQHWYEGHVYNMFFLLNNGSFAVLKGFENFPQYSWNARKSQGDPRKS